MICTLFISEIRGGGEARHFKRTFFLKKKGAFYRNKNGTSLFIAKSSGGGEACAPVPLGSYVYGDIISYFRNIISGHS